ncbi:MAG: MBL fold metallo-hydrolase, partial [Candidatus Micrarchaeota archaeon]|nr:MBL fold metallo-hydrolase [Candidatus Micrarchaeota archaeon]
VILSHGHLDHCGSIPALFKHNAPRVFCTTPTLSIANILYNDTLKIARQERLPSPFSPQDLKKALNYFSTLGYGQEFKITPELSFSFVDAGHIIGAAQVVIKAEKKKLIYSGDLKLNETRMHSGADIEKNPDGLIMESTYGDKSQADRKKVEETFFSDVQDVVDGGGTALVPCFAVGRTQEVLTLLGEKNFRGDIYIDGMGTRVNEVYYQYAGYLRNGKGFKAALQRAKIVSSREERKDCIEGGNVILTTAGMLEGGPVLSYLQAMEQTDLPNKIFLTGYQAPGTNGRRLLNNEPLVIHGNLKKYYRVTTPFKLYEFSAHADQSELLDYAKKVNPEKIYCVHGDDTNAFAELLQKEGFDASAPVNGEKVTDF